MRQTISLDGEWERRDFLDEAWRWSDALRGSVDAAAVDGPPIEAVVSAGWRVGRVPGSAIDDAWRAGEVPNPYVDRHSLDAEWIPQRTWLYRRRLRTPEDAPEHAVLRFDGIDPGGTIFLDGEEIGRHRGMFLPLELDLGGRLVPGGEHDLVVAVDPAPPMPSQVGRTELAREHKSRMGYGWDFCPRMVHTGIWRSVSLELYRSRLTAPRISVALASDHGFARVEVEAAVQGEARSVKARVVDPDGRIVAEDTVPAEPRVRVGLDVSEPRLWWPNGDGEPAIHRLQLTLEGDGTLDERSMKFGIRSVAMAPTEAASPDARPYTVVLNGRPTWIRGWNWVPLDAAYGVPRLERLRHLIELARRANVNLLRVWGGGLIESEAFYDACDESGIMVWQEFAQSSSGLGNTPADDPAFVDLIRREAEVIVPLRTHHPSLVIWCGGNELTDGDNRPLDDRHPVLATLRDIVQRLDPTGIWLPTSPSGPRFENSIAAAAEHAASLHDVHGPWEHQGLAAQHELANATTSLLHSEFGAEGITNLSSLFATVTQAERSPLDRSNPVMAHRGAWWNNEPFVQRAFGGGLTLEELERASQHLQADGLRTLVEGDRRRWPRNAGAIPWQLNEPFPNAWSTAAVDYFGMPKAAYHAVADAYATVAVGLVFASPALDGARRIVVAAWVANGAEPALGGSWHVAVHDATGLLLADAAEPIAVPAGGVAVARDVALDLPAASNDLLVLTATFTGQDGQEARTRRLLSRTANLQPMRRLAPAVLDVAISADGDHRWLVSLTCGGPTAGLEIRLDDARPAGWPERIGAPYPDASLVTLLPGETRAVEVDWREVAMADRALRLSGWNVSERILTHG